jgi:hypothetical protein
MKFKKPKPLSLKHRKKRQDEYRTVDMDDELYEAMLRQKQRFIEKFGREPGPGDPVFFDEDADEPKPMDDRVWEEILFTMEEVGIPPQLRYAARKTGRIASEDSWDKLTPEEQKEWTDAVEEYFEKVKGKEKERPS